MSEIVEIMKKRKVDFDNEFLFSPIQRQILKLLDKVGPMTRRELISVLKRSRTTVYDNLTRLQFEGIIKKKSKYLGKQGRPEVYFFLVEKRTNTEIIKEMIVKLKELE